MITTISLVKFRKRVLPILRFALIAGILIAIAIRLFVIFFQKSV